MKKRIPFVFGKIVSEDTFCNRVEEKKLIKEYIDSAYSFWLFAPRRFGKSSLIKQVFKEIESDTKTIYLDLYNIKTTDEFARKYSKLIAQELFNWKDDLKELSKNIQSYFKKLYPSININENGNPSLVLAKNSITEQEDIETILNLPEKIAQERNIKICIAFDEFQEVDRIDKFIINWMRSAFQNHQNVSYVFLGSKQTLMENIFSSINSPFYEFAIKMDIKPIKREELFNFIEQKFKENKLTIYPETINDILDKSGCHPHFTQYFASVVYNEILNEEDQKVENFSEKWMEKIIDGQSLIFQNIFDQLTNSQRNILTALCYISKDIFTNEAKEKYYLPVSSSLSRSLDSLQKKDLIYKVGKEYKISNPVLKYWLIQLNEK